MCDIQEILTEELNPTFLFTWTGVRTRDEQNYHCHENQIEMSLIMSGSGRYRIDGEIFRIVEGDLLILNPGCYHQALTDGGGNPIVEFFVGFTDIALKGMEKNRFEIKGAPVIHTRGELRQRLFRIARNMQMENETWQQGRYFMLRSYLVQMLLLLIREQAEQVKPRKGYAFESVSKKYVVEQIQNYFEDHYAEKISLDQIAENMYLSPFYISKIFKSETGDTPIHYLINIRLERAKDILEKGECNSIQEVASMVGYEDAYHFSKLFKKKYKVPPSRISRGK